MHQIASNHFKIISKINGVKGWFILDTGASSTFIDLKLEDKFKLKSETSMIKATGAGPNKLTTLLSKNNSINIRGWSSKKFQITLIDLSYVNNAVESIESSPVDGIIGADLLKLGMRLSTTRKNSYTLSRESKKSRNSEIFCFSIRIY